MNKKIISSLLALIMVASLGVTAFATTLTENPTAGSTAVEYVGTQQESWTVTIPAKLVPGGAAGTVEVEGTWASNRMLNVTAPATVEMTNSIKASDTKTLRVTFAGIAKVGDNTVAVSDKTNISVARISNALFGTWSGTINFNISLVSHEHTANDDGDCTTPVNCSICGAEIIAAHAAHAFTDESDMSCNNENCSITRVTFTLDGQSVSVAEGTTWSDFINYGRDINGAGIETRYWVNGEYIDIQGPDEDHNRGALFNYANDNYVMSYYPIIAGDYSYKLFS